MKAPLISIVILTYNNSSILQRCLESVLTLDYPNREIIVVDNASSDGTVELVEREYASKVKLLARDSNSPVAARNQGYEEARGELVLSLDHDMVFSDTQVLFRAVDIFEQLPDVGLLAFKICSEDAPDEPLHEHWWYPAPLEEAKNKHFYTNYFSEGAAFFRADAIRDTGGYDENFFYFAENLDLSLNLANRGWRTLYCASLSTVELVVSEHQSRLRSKGNYYFLRNRLWVVRKHYPLLRGLAYIIPRIGIAAIKSIRFAWFDYFLLGLKDGIFAPQAIRGERHPLGNAVFSEMKRMEGVPINISSSPILKEEGELIP